MKKRFGKLLALLLCLVMALSLGLAGCGKTPSEGGTPPDGNEEIKPGDNDPNTKPGDEDPGTKPGDEDPGTKPGDDDPTQDTFTVSYRKGYTPTRFEYVSNEVTKLADGVYLVANTITLQNGAMKGKTSVVYTIEIDLEKANVVAGTKGNVAYGFDWTKAAPYQTALDWEAATGGHVYASINADFFGGQSVNAFVKDGVIVKAGHNDNGNYDYKNTSSDVPASAPLLFGVKGTTAQIAPIVKVDGDPTTAKVKEQFVKAKLTYGLEIGKTMYALKTDQAPSTTEVSYIANGSVSVNGCAVKVDVSKGPAGMEILEVVTPERRTEYKAEDGIAWIVAGSKTNTIANYLKGLKVGEKMSLSVTSPDGTWNGYETILGCRQALVIDDEIASTVTLENTNSAQGQDIPRTAVGVKDGKVVLIAVESMYYYKRDKEGDTHGLNLPELAEFAYYYGCTDAANFDGGGSTHLVVHPEGEEAKTVIRSADTAGWGLKDTRVVVNAFLITSRKGN